MPQAIQYTPDIVAGAALDLVREHGLDALTARAVASRLGCSVAPVYSAFGSMAGLTERIMHDGLGMLERAGAKDYSDGAFLNRGIGLVAFARDEPRLFLALYRAGRGGSFNRYRDEVRRSMRTDHRLGSLPDAALNAVFERLWTYALGMAMSMLFDYAEDRSDLAVALELRSAGSTLMYGVLAGIDDYGSAPAREHWAALAAKQAMGQPLTALTIQLNPALGRQESI